MSKKKKILSVFVLLSLSFLLLQQSSAFLEWVSEKPVINLFILNKPEHQIDEKFDGEIKEDITVENTGSIDVYVRVLLSPQWTWEDEDGQKHVDIEPFEIDFDLDDKWLKRDGIYYYKEVLRPGDKTTDLLNGTKIKAKPKENKTLEIDVIAESIQTKPIDKVEDAWSIEIDESNGMIVGVRDE